MHDMPPGQGMSAGAAIATTQPPMQATTTAIARPSWLQRLLEGFAHKLLNVRTMRWPLRVLVALVLVQVLAAIVLVAFPNLPQPTLTNIAPDAPNAKLPVFALGLGIVMMPFAWALLLTGALHGAGRLRLGMLAALLAALFNMPLLFFGSGPVLGFDLGLVAIALVPLAGLVLWAWLVSALDRRAARAPAGTLRTRMPRSATFVFVWAMLALYYTPSLLAAVGLREPSVLTDLLGIHIMALSLVLAPVFVLLGKDIADAGETTAERALAVLRLARAPWLLAALAGVVAVGGLMWSLLAVSGIHGDLSVTAIVFLAPQLVAVVGILVAVRVGHVASWPVFHLQARALVLCAIIVVAAAFTDGVTRQYAVSTLVSTLSIVGGYALVWRRRGSPRQFAVVGLFLVVFGFEMMTPALKLALMTALNDTATGTVYSGVIISLQCIVALATLGGVGWLALRRHVQRDGPRLLARLIVLNVALAVVAWSASRFASNGTGHGIGGVAGLLLVGAIAWELLSSGEMTNADSRQFPRSSRVLLYLGYTLIVTLVVLFAAVPGLSPEGLAVLSITKDELASSGLTLLGSAVLLTSFVLHVVPRQRPAASAQGEAATSPSVPLPPAHPAMPPIPPSYGPPWAPSPSWPMPPTGASQPWAPPPNQPGAQPASPPLQPPLQ